MIGQAGRGEPGRPAGAAIVPTVRTASPGEAALIIENAASTYADQLAESADLGSADAAREAADQLARLLPDGLATPGMVFLVAETAGRVVGGVWLARRAGNGRDLAWVYDLHVDPDARGRGVARQLMLAAQQRARELGAPAVGLNVFAPNLVARRLYESLGYTVTAQQMQLPLDPG